MHKPESVPENEKNKIVRDFEIQTDHLSLTGRPNQMLVNEKKRTCRMVDFVVPADYRVNIKESEKRDNYLDFTRKLKKLWNM